MSQMTAASPRRVLQAPRRGATASPLRVMPTRFAATGNGAFATLCLVLLTVGLIALLLLNTALAQGSLALGQLQRESAALTNTATNLRAEIAAASASGTLAATAAKMGMVRSNERAYIDLSTGKVSGTAYPATSYQAFSIVTRPTPPPRLTGSDQKLLTTATTSVLAAVASLVPKTAVPADPKAATKPAAKTSVKPGPKPAVKGAATPKTPPTTATTPTTPRLGTKPGSAAGGTSARPGSQTPAIR